MSHNLDLIKPGDILATEFLEPMNISQNQLARDIDVSVSKVNNIIHANGNINADFALRLAKYFGTSAELWMNLQSHFDLEKAKKEKGDYINSRVRVAPQSELKH